MREPEEVERFWFTFSPAGAVFGCEAAELRQSGFLRMYRESELLQSALHGYTKALSVDSLVEPDDYVICVSDHDHIACGMAASPLMRPQIEDIVEVDVCQQRRDNRTLLKCMIGFSIGETQMGFLPIGVKKLLTC